MSLTLNKTLRNLGKRNAIKVDTKAAESAISRLDKKIRALSRNVSVGARTSVSGGRNTGSGGSAVGPLLAMGMSSSQMRANTDQLKKVEQIYAEVTKKTSSLSREQQRLNQVNELAKRVTDKVNAASLKLVQNEEKLTKAKRRQKFAQNMSKKENQSAKLQVEALTNWNKRYNEQLKQQIGLLGKVKNAQKNRAAQISGKATNPMAKGAMAGAGTAAALSGIPGSQTAVGGFIAGKIATGSTAGGVWGAVAAGALTAGFEVAKFARQSTIASAEFEKMKLALTGVVSSNEDYAKSLSAVDDISKSLLIPQAKVMKSFTRLQAAASASGFEVDEMKTMMKGFSSALVATEGDTQNFNGVMLALSQVLGKGKAAAEEIRGQIGERLSVVIPELAASMKITTAELDTLFDEGKVTVQDIVNLGEHLEKKYGESAANIIKSQMNAGERLKYELSRLSLAVGPLFEDIGAGFQGLGETIVQALIPAIEKVSELFAVTKKGKQLKIDYLVDKNERLDKSAGIKKIFQKTWIPRQEIMEYLKLTNSGEGAKQMLTNKFGEKATKNLTSVDFFKLRQKQERDARVQKIRDQLKEKPTTGTKGEKPEGGDPKAEAKRKADWKKIEDRLKIDLQFQRDRIALGVKEAEIQRQLNELKMQFPKTDLTGVEQSIRTLSELEEQTVSNKVAFKELQEEAAKRLRDLYNPVEQLKVITETFNDSFSQAIQEVVQGTKSMGDAIASMLTRIGNTFIQTAADMAAAAATKGLTKFLMGSLFKSFDLGGTSSIGSQVGDSLGSYLPPAPLPAIPDTITNTGGNYNFASGGYVDRPTKALIGEGSEGEYVIPESKLNESLSRYQAGHRGSSVVPGGVGGTGNSAGGSGEVTVNYTGPTLNFNGDEYVPRSAVPQIINSAAKAGASAGASKTFNELKNSRSQRARLGL